MKLPYLHRLSTAHLTARSVYYYLIIMAHNVSDIRGSYLNTLFHNRLMSFSDPCTEKCVPLFLFISDIFTHGRYIAGKQVEQRHFLNRYQRSKLEDISQNEIGIYVTLDSKVIVLDRILEDHKELHVPLYTLQPCCMLGSDTWTRYLTQKTSLREDSAP
jgi:hypothetical protein